MLKIFIYASLLLLVYASALAKEPSTAYSDKNTQAPQGMSLTQWKAIKNQIHSNKQSVSYHEAYLKPSNTPYSGAYAASVAISGNTLVVGAYSEHSASTGVNGDEENTFASYSGAAYVFVKNNNVWTQQAYLKASNTEYADRFGVSVAISGDTIVVSSLSEDSDATGVNDNQADNSAPNSGAAYVFVRNNNTWSQQAYLKASNTQQYDNFGENVAISEDTIVIGSIVESSNSTGVNGNQADNSATYSGAAYVFFRTDGQWTQQAYLKASNTEKNDNFGYSLAISEDTIVVGAQGEDSRAEGVNGDQADNLGIGVGAAYVFVRNNGIWTQQAYLKASNARNANGYRFGNSAAISKDTIVIGSIGESSNATGVNGDQTDRSTFSGAAYVFIRNNGIWSQQAYLKASNTGLQDDFGYSVAISRDIIAVGAPSEDSQAIGVYGDQIDNSAQQSGAVYVFVRNNGIWSQQAYVKASNTDPGDTFGNTVAVSSKGVFVGALGESSISSGVNGDQADNSRSETGAVYVIAFEDIFANGFE